jgi:ubiquinone/menaquinone biosynthesis C-methylase UbiE
MADTGSSAAFHDFEHAGWQRAAAAYADTLTLLTSQTTGPLLDAAGAGPGVRLLDVATGPGVVASAAAERRASVTGLDFSSAMIAVARGRHPSITFREGNAQALPFDAASFDAVVMNFGLLHLAEPEQAIVEAHRVLRPGGRYAFTVWAEPDQALGFGMVLRAIQTFGQMDVGLPEGPAFFRFSDPAEMRQVLERAGFHQIEIRTLPLEWRLSSADGVFDALSEGGVRTAAVLRAQAPNVLERIRAAVRHDVEAFARGGGFVVPMPAMLASASR